LKHVELKVKWAYNGKPSQGIGPKNEKEIPVIIEPKNMNQAPVQVYLKAIKVLEYIFKNFFDKILLYHKVGQWMVLL
jgi:hypothetical protein